MHRNTFRFIDGRWIVGVLLIALLGSACRPGIEDNFHALQAPEPSIRLDAVEALRHSGDPRAFDLLVLALKDAEPRVARRAVTAIGESDRPEALGHLIATLEHPDAAVRFAAEEALRRRQAVAVEPLLERLRRPADGSTAAVIELLGRLGDARAVAPIVAALNDSRDERLHLAAVDALVKLGDPRAVPALMTIVRDRQSVARFVAADALTSFGPAAVPALISALANDDEETARMAAASLGRIGDPRAVSPLVSALGNRKSDALRMSAAEALGELGTPAVIAPLIEALSDEFRAVREKAAAALEQVGPSAAPALREELARRDPRTLAFTIRILGSLKDSSAAAPLIRLLETERSGRLRYACIQALGTIGHPRAVAPLVTALGDPSSEIADAAQKALTEIGVPAVDALGRRFTEADSKLRTRIADVLVTIGEPAAAALARVVSRNPHRSGAAAARALVRIGKAAVPELIALLTATDPKSRALASDALSAIGKPAVAPLIESLNRSQKDAEVLAAVTMLARLGDRRAREPLAAALSRWNVRREAARALDTLGWKPRTSAEDILYLAAGGNRQALLDRWDETRTVLFDLLRSAQREPMACAVNTFIEIGREDIFPELVRLLDAEGNRLMAEVYQNCGHQLLNRAAQKWLANH